MTRNIEFSTSGREPRQGELTYEMKRILNKHCRGKSLKQAQAGVQLAVIRLAKRFGFNEFKCSYDRHTALPGKPWVTERLQVLIWRRQSNGTLSIYRSGATTYPRFFQLEGKEYANLSAPRDMTIYYGVDEPYSWENHYRSKKLPARIERKIARSKAKKEKAHANP